MSSFELLLHLLPSRLNASSSSLFRNRSGRPRTAGVREPRAQSVCYGKTRSLHVSSKSPVTATIFLIRHAAHVELGRTLSGRRRDIALSPDGLEQAEIVADLLGVEPLAAVYSSPRERAYYTARAIAEQHEL